MAAALVLLATAGVFYFLGNRTTAAAGIGSAGRPAIAVVGFENPEGNSDSNWLTTAMPRMLLTALGQTAGLDVIGRQRVDEVLKEIGVAEGARIDPGRVLDVGRRAGAGAMVVGSVFKGGIRIPHRRASAGGVDRAPAWCPHRSWCRRLCAR